MFWAFCKYFFHYIFFSKTRQRLLFVAIFGLFVSSFALIVLQSTMGGLQKNVVGRSKAVLGDGVITLRDRDVSFGKEVSEMIRGEGFQSFLEYEIELLIRHEGHISPVIVHGLEDQELLPEFLQSADLKGDLILPLDLLQRLRINGGPVKLISPGHVDSFLGDIPRQATVYVDHYIQTDVPEIDSLHVWTRLPLIQNLIKAREANKIRIYGKKNLSPLKKKLQEKYSDKIIFKTWEDYHQNLVWALHLESVMMVFLFVAMTLLVSLSITSGLLIFFDKIKIDLASFWVIGSSKKSLEKASSFFLHMITLFSVGGGLVTGLIVLWFLDHYSPKLLPDNFVDQQLPVYITGKGLLISFLVPYLISFAFSKFSLEQFKKDHHYLDHVRSLS